MPARVARDFLNIAWRVRLGLCSRSRFEDRHDAGLFSHASKGCGKVGVGGADIQGLRQIDPMLAARVGERVTLRYDLRDLARIRVFHDDRFLCRGI